MKHLILILPLIGCAAKGPSGAVIHQQSLFNCGSAYTSDVIEGKDMNRYVLTCRGANSIPVPHDWPETYQPLPDDRVEL